MLELGLSSSTHDSTQSRWEEWTLSPSFTIGWPSTQSRPTLTYFNPIEIHCNPTAILHLFFPQFNPSLQTQGETKDTTSYEEKNFLIMTSPLPIPWVRLVEWWGMRMKKIIQSWVKKRKTFPQLLPTFINCWLLTTTEQSYKVLMSSSIQPVPIELKEATQQMLTYTINNLSTQGIIN